MTTTRLSPMPMLDALKLTPMLDALRLAIPTEPNQLLLMGKAAIPTEPGRLLLLMGQVFVGASLCKVVLLWCRTRRIKRVLRDVPSSRYKDGFMGAMGENAANTHRMNEWLTDITAGLPLSTTYNGDLMPAATNIFVRDPAVVKHFLKDNFENYTKPDPEQDLLWFFINEWLGSGIFTALHGPGAKDDGKNWAMQRKIASNIFSKNNFNSNMHAVFLAKAEVVSEMLEKHATAGTKVDLEGIAFNFTMDSVMEIFFGEKADSVNGAHSVYGKAYDSAQKHMVDYLDTNNAMLLLTQSMLAWPLGSSRGLLWKVHQLTNTTYRAFMEARRILDRESYRMVEQCRADPRKDERKDLLALFVAQEEEKKFSTKFLRDVVVSFVIAGRDTTACLLSWIFYELSTRPLLQEKLCEEIDQKLPSGTVPTLKGVSLSEMPYLHAVIYEALRLYPPIPWNSKQAVKDDVLPDGTRVPAGVQLHFCPYAVGRDPVLYPEPEVFKPERWIPFHKPQPYDFPNFQAGPRICIGAEMAIFEAKVFVTTLLQRYSFTLMPGEKIFLKTGLTLCPCNAEDQSTTNLWLMPKYRQKASA